MSLTTKHRCALSTPGHTPRFIQAKRALGNRAPRRLDVLEVTDAGIVVTDGSSAEAWLMHARGRRIVQDALMRGLTHLHDQGTAFAVMGGIGISYCEDEAEWRECAPTDTNSGGPVDHFLLDRYDARTGCADEASGARPGGTMAPGTRLVVR